MVAETESKPTKRRQFKAIRPDPSRLANEVYRQVLDAVLAGAVLPGERIVQERLADEINVSRTPVREALLRLEREGVLERAGSAGFAVREVSEPEVCQIYQTREAIEGHAARIVAEQRRPESLNRIGRTVKTEEALDAGDVEAYFHANRRIHRQIVQETDNDYLMRSFDAVWNRGFSFRVFAIIEAVDLRASLREHEKLLVALRDASPAEAGEAMIAHIRDGLELQLRALREQSR